MGSGVGVGVGFGIFLGGTIFSFWGLVWVFTLGIGVLGITLGGTSSFFIDMFSFGTTPCWVTGVGVWIGDGEGNTTGLGWGDGNTTRGGWGDGDARFCGEG